jgi:tetratricopeptide (TPR) repeat protein
MKVQIFGRPRRISIVMLLAAMVTSPAAAQRAGTTMRDSIGDAAASLLNQGRVNEARITLLRAMRESSSHEQQAIYRLELGDTFMYEGKYQEATRAYTAVISGKDSVRVDSLIRWAHHGLALIDAFNGRPARAATHYAAALQGPTTIRDTIEMLVLTAQHDSALRAIDRFAASHHEPSALQFAQAFRGLSWMMSGHCTEALPEIAKAPQQDRPVPIAIRGRCAIKHGQRLDALAMRDSVLKHQVADPFAWTVLIARDAARKIE